VGEASAPRVTVVVVSYNGRGEIEACLESMVTSGIDPAQILVVDNDSRDGTPELVGSRFPDVNVLKLGGNRGYGGAANLAASASSGEYIALVNQDMVFRHGWLDHLVRALETDPDAALATPKVLLLGDPARVNACGNMPHYSGITTCRGYGQRADAFTRPEAVPAVSGAAFLIRRAAFEEINRFDPLFFMYLEDTDLSLRAGLAGFRCLFVPDAVVLHRFSPTFSSAKVYWLERNRTMMLVKVYRWRTLLLLTPALLLTDMLVLAYGLAHGPRHVLAKAKAYAWVARRWPTIMANRRHAQRIRRTPDRELLRTFGVRLDIAEIDSPVSRSGATVANLFYARWHTLIMRVVTW
jgi:hypothetical protein